MRPRPKDKAPRPLHPPPGFNRPPSWYNPYAPEPGSRLRISCHVDDFEAEDQRSIVSSDRDEGYGYLTDSDEGLVKRDKHVDQSRWVARSRLTKVVRRSRWSKEHRKDVRRTAVLSRQRLSSVTIPVADEPASDSSSSGLELSRQDEDFRAEGNVNQSTRRNRDRCQTPDRGFAHDDQSQESVRLERREPLDREMLTDVAERGCSWIESNKAKCDPAMTILETIEKSTSDPCERASSFTDVSISDRDQWLEKDIAPKSEDDAHIQSSPSDTSPPTYLPTPRLTNIPLPLERAQKRKTFADLLREQRVKPRRQSSSPRHTKSSSPEPQLAIRSLAGPRLKPAGEGLHSDADQDGTRSVSPKPHDVADSLTPITPRHDERFSPVTPPSLGDALLDSIERGQRASEKASRIRKFILEPESARKRIKLAAISLPEPRSKTSEEETLEERLAETKEW